MTKQTEDEEEEFERQRALGVDTREYGQTIHGGEGLMPRYLAR